MISSARETKSSPVYYFRGGQQCPFGLSEIECGRGELGQAQDSVLPTCGTASPLDQKSQQRPNKVLRTVLLTISATTTTTPTVQAEVLLFSAFFLGGGGARCRLGEERALLCSLPWSHTQRSLRTVRCSPPGWLGVCASLEFSSLVFR